MNEQIRDGNQPMWHAAASTAAGSRLPVGVRWTIGNVSDRGFEALRLSVWGAWHIFGPQAGYAVCVNTISAPEAIERSGALPPGVIWHEVSRELPEFLQEVFGPEMAEGVAWKLTPLQVFPDRHELSLDNDCILWTLPSSIRQWLAADPASQECLIAQDVKRCCGQFADQCPPQPCNSGIRGLPPGFDLGSRLREVIATRRRQLGSPLHLTSELDEQGMQTAALWLPGPLRFVSTGEVSICSPFHPHLPDLGSCGAHFVGLNGRHIAWDYHGRPADVWMHEHWQRHRALLYRRTGTPLEATAQV